MSRANIALVLLLACLATLPLFGGAYALRLGSIACLYAIMALSWNVVGGFAGYPSFATAAFFGFGAYAGGVLMTKGVPLPLAVLISGVAAFVGATVLGAALLRLRELVGRDEIDRAENGQVGSRKISNRRGGAFPRMRITPLC